MAEGGDGRGAESCGDASSCVGETPSERLLMANWRLFRASQKAGYDALVREAADIFGAPVVYVDELFQVLSRHPRHDPRLERLLSVNNQQSVLPERLWNIFSECLMGVEPFYEPFYCDTGACAQTPCLFGVVAREGEARGHVVVQLGETALRPEDLEIVSILTELLRAKVERRSFRLDNRMAGLISALQLVVSADVPERRARAAAQTLREALRPGYQIMATTFESVPAQRVLADYTACELRRRYPDAVSAVFEGAVVTLVGALPPGRRVGARENPVVARFLPHMERYQLTAGLSATFDDPAAARVHYRQALLAARMATRMGVSSPAAYMDHMPYCLASALLESERPETFVHPALPRMAEHDREHGTQHLETLRAFVLEMGDRRRAACDLGVHKNTLAYRLERIERLFDVRLDEPEELVHLILSFLVWDVSRGRVPSRDGADAAPPTGTPPIPTGPRTPPTRGRR